MEGDTIMEFNVTLVTWINSKEYNFTIFDFEFVYKYYKCPKEIGYFILRLSIFPVGEKWRSLFSIGYDNVYRRKRKLILHLLWIIV